MLDKDRGVQRRRTRSARRPRAILLDALGTLLRLEPPVDPLRAELRARAGVDISAADARRALEAEIAYYRASHLRGSDPDGLAQLRRDCASVLAGALGVAIPLDRVREALLAALRFSAFPDAAPALARARADGRRLVVVSNWDCSLPSVLERAGLAGAVDGVVASAMVGAAKPDPRAFAAALAAAGCEPAEAVMVGDSIDADVAGARACGIAAVLIRRPPATTGAPAGVPLIAGLAELASVT